MEGISSEAASLAGHLGLANLCWIYDNNRITIEGSTAPRVLRRRRHALHRLRLERHARRRRQRPRDARARVRDVQATRATRPTLIIVDSHIAYGAPTKQGTSAAHGEPLGEEEVRLTKRAYGWPEDAQFLVPDGVREHFAAELGERGRELREAWMERFERYQAEHPDLADQLLRMQRRELPDGWDAEIPEFPPDEKGVAGREASGKVLNAIAKHAPVAARRRGRPRAVDQDAADVRGRGRRSAARTGTAATCTSACASTRWARRSTGSRCRSCARSAPAS